MRRLLILAVPALIGAGMYGSHAVQLAAVSQPLSTAGLQSCIDAIVQENLQAVGLDCPAVPSSPSLPAGAGQAFVDSQFDNLSILGRGSLPFYPADQLSDFDFECSYNGGTSCTGNFGATEDIAAPDPIDGTCDASWTAPLSAPGGTSLYPYDANSGTWTAECQAAPLSGGPAVTFSMTIVAVDGEGAYVVTS